MVIISLFLISFLNFDTKNNWPHFNSVDVFKAKTILRNKFPPGLFKDLKVLRIIDMAESIKVMFENFN